MNAMKKKEPELYDRTWMSKARALKGLLQVNAAEECGISPGFYNRIEQGVQTPNVRVGLVICKVLGVSPDVWLTEKRIA